jgi:hypothetical protein
VTIFETMAGVYGISVETFMVFFYIYLAFIVFAYVYYGITLMTIAKKLKHPTPWLSWIPGANISLVLMLGKFHWAWVFLIFAGIIPLVNIVAVIGLAVLRFMSYHRMGDQLNFPGWTVWLVIIPFFGSIWMYVYLGILAWKQ